MDEDAFWALIDELSRRPGDRDERLEWLTGRLLLRPAAESAVFQARLERACAVAQREDLWRAADRVEGGACTDDGFHYFTLWLVAQGSEVYGEVLDDPDALAGLPGIRALAGRPGDLWRDDEWPEWEELDYAAQDAFDELTGQEDDDGEQFLDAVEAAEEAAVAAGEWEEWELPEGHGPLGVGEFPAGQEFPGDWDFPAGRGLAGGRGEPELPGRRESEFPGGRVSEGEEGGGSRGSRSEGVALPRLTALFPVGAPAS
ncbi:DUF4240 domain-containing protein [Streptomyces sp. NPDC094049]|uniref:DUF4240 domain-containing protein n=1 Tax=Streptomyces sp. NPDC094049 TaxID=3154987 RepID=UPI003325A0DF